jgi:ATP-dependent Lon protease
MFIILKDEKEQIGVATGLAYTQFGGDTLPVEVTYYKGKGSLVLTGKLGDVMKESAQTAFLY